MMKWASFLLCLQVHRTVCFKSRFVFFLLYDFTIRNIYLISCAEC